MTSWTQLLETSRGGWRLGQVLSTSYRSDWKRRSDALTRRNLALQLQIGLDEDFGISSFSSRSTSVLSGDLTPVMQTSSCL